MNNFSDIVAYVRVVEAHSFVAAAQTLGMSPSAISKAVSRLEERLGARLLNRTTRSLSLTDVGSSFYERCRDALGQLDHAESEVSESRGVPRGRLRVDVPVSLGRRLIVPALPRFIAQYPEISVQMSMNDRVVDLVQEGIDAALRVGNLSDSSLIARRIAQLRGVTCASPEFIERYGEPRDPTELKPEHCITMFKLGNNQTRDWLFRKGAVEHQVTPAARLSFSDPESAVQAAVSGAGFVRALDFTVEAQVAAGLLRPVLQDWNDGAWWPISVVYPQHRQPTAKIRAFIDFVSGLFPQINGANGP
ncbi:MAG TPA: LysR family transcriptional regulator [Povalibacter sp.]|nr:LysR family transcriptional regulator [Povalibacter sp.]